MAWTLYQLAMALLLVVAGPFLLVRRGRHYLETLAGRWGRYAAPATGRGRLAGGRLWIHAISVGEVAVAVTLARALPGETPLVVTTITPTGQKRAQAAFKARESAAVAYFPFDFAFALRRFFHRFEPAALILVEGDYWPLAMRFVRRRRLPAAVVNGRVSERSFQRLRLLGSLPRRLLYAGVEHFGMQTTDDRRRLLELGVEPERITVTGNLKYDTAAPKALPALEAGLRRHAAGRPILIAGSTMRGEEELVLEAFERCGGAESALLLLVPRHPERWDGVARLVEERGLRLLRRSSIEEETEGKDETTRADVVLLDTLGELAALYRVAAMAFIGGTLVPTGGHNPLEAAHFAVPIVVGASMHNFAEMAAEFDAAAAWYRVSDTAGLARVWQNGLAEPEDAAATGRRGAELLERNRGALERTRELLEPLLQTIEKNSPKARGDRAR